MYKPRIIPVLLLQENGLVKTTQFKSPRYLGDPINAVKLFNDFQVDEIVLLNIDKNIKSIPLNLLQEINEEANMPFSYGGGISRLEEIENLIKSGVERIILNTALIEKPEFVRQAVNAFGSSTIIASVDIKTDVFGRKRIYYKRKNKLLKINYKEFISQIEGLGVGEILLQTVYKDGEMNGYDIELFKDLTRELSIPVTAVGGAGSLNDIKKLIKNTEVSGAAAGSLFVYHGARKAFLINYPNIEEKKELYV